MQLLLDGSAPVDLGMQQPSKPRPVATLDSVKHVAYGWNLFCHR
jgi:hypothetical protein